MSQKQPTNRPKTAGEIATTLEELTRQMRLSQMMNDAGIDRVQALDTELRIVTWNRMCEEVTGLSRANVIGNAWLDVFPAAREWPAVMEALQRALQGHRSFVPAERGAYEAGHFERHFVPLKDEDGLLQGVLVIIHDVAHRVKAENELKILNRELQQKYRELQRANAELATFTHVTSHDLKEPLRKIYTFVELTITEEQGRMSDKGRSNLRRVQSSVQRMGLLTDDLVIFSEISAGNEPSELLNLNEILAEARKPLQKTIAETNAVIEAQELPAIWGPRRQFTLLFQHLLSNAVKFVEPGREPHVRIEASVVAGSDVPSADANPDTDYTMLCFTDNGIGIEPEFRDKIFALFQRLHARGEYGGTGIGLAICKKVVEHRGGFITVESEAGKGSRFCCWLPAGKPSALRAAAQVAVESTAT